MAPDATPSGLTTGRYSSTAWTGYRTSVIASRSMASFGGIERRSIIAGCGVKKRPSFPSAPPTPPRILRSSPPKLPRCSPLDSRGGSPKTPPFGQKLPIIQLSFPRKRRGHSVKAKAYSCAVNSTQHQVGVAMDSTKSGDFVRILFGIALLLPAPAPGFAQGITDVPVPVRQSGQTTC